MTEPLRKTCLATVEAVQGDWFQVDRALFAPTSRACRHPQYSDSGNVWVDGDKRKLAGIRVGTGKRAGTWYRLKGTIPNMGEALQCELDQKRRDETARTHTGMHLMLAALGAMKLSAMVADCEVKGAGHFRLTFADVIPRHFLAAALKLVHEEMRADKPISRSFASRNEIEHFARPQSFRPPDPFPGGESVSLVTIGDCGLPCDGSHVDRTGRLSSVAIAHARPGKDGFVVVGQVK
jgi:Ser-tRNA(Ala) deacylase AlaX